nr:type I restriction enzyme HsdR N-terminal domain-containing protein [Desulfobacula sp.]
MIPDSNPHHLVLGELKDFLTGLNITDTHDERYRQKIAKLLVLEKAFDKADIEAGKGIEISAGGKKAGIKIDYLVGHQGKIVMLIKYAPGSLVTRRLSTLALSRIVRPYQILVVVIANGEDAEVMEGDSGRVTATGLDNIPDKDAIMKNYDSFSFKPIKTRVFDQASKIVFACGVDGACPCDSDICLLDEKDVSR